MLELEDLLEEGGEEVEGTLGEAEEGEEEATEQDGDSDSLHYLL